MEINQSQQPFEMLIIKDTFSNDELKKIWIELEHLHSANSFLPANIYNGAVDNSGKLHKKNLSLFLDTVYTQRKFSTILPLLEKKLFSDEVRYKMMSINPAFNNFQNLNSHTTLVSYYENSDYYKPHIDSSVFSTLTYIFKEPKNFTGGDIFFHFNEKKLKINVENNLSIVFPSGYLHEVDPVNMIDMTIPLSGRHCLSIFTGICHHVS